MCSWLTKDGDDIVHLASKKSVEELSELLQKHHKMIVIYPLYVDSMPGIVKLFFENLESNQLFKGKDILFIIHSGFSEAVHLRVLERYHAILKDILQLNTVETIITPGSEGVRLMPDSMNKKRRTLLLKVNESFRRSNTIDTVTKNNLAGDETMSKNKKFFIRIANFLGLTKIYWNRQLKRNNAYKKRFDKPYK